ncbi:MAG TPA: hypothetical protein VH878_03600 [Thermodesulfobacteriota bacterium]
MIDAERKRTENGTVLLFKGIPDDEETMLMIVDTKKTRHMHFAFSKSLKRRIPNSRFVRHSTCMGNVNLLTSHTQAFFKRLKKPESKDHFL